MVGAAVVDEVGELLLFLLLPGRLEAAPLRRHEFRLAVLPELAIGVEALGPDDLAILEIDRRLLEPVRPHGAEPLVGHERAAIGVLFLAVHHGVVFSRPCLSLAHYCALILYLL